METNIKEGKRKKERIKRFAVIKFIEPHELCHDDYTCVPNSWLKHRRSFGKAFAACPDCEDVSELKDLAKKRTKVEQSWSVYFSVIEYETNSYKDAEVWIAKKKRCGSIPKKDPTERDTQQEPVLNRKLRSSVSNCLSNPKTNKRYENQRKPLPRMLIRLRPEIERTKWSNIGKSTKSFINQENMKTGCSNKEQTMVTENPQPSCSSQIEKTAVVSNVDKSLQPDCIAENKSIAKPESSNIDESTSSKLIAANKSSPIRQVSQNDSVLKVDRRKNTMDRKLQPKSILKKSLYFSEIPSTLNTQTASALRYNSLQTLYMQEMSNEQYKERNNYVQETDVNSDVMITSTAEPPTLANEPSQLYQHPSFKISQRLVSSHVPQEICSDTSTKMTLDGKRKWSDDMANRTPLSSLPFSDKVKLKSLQSSEKTPLSFIENPVNKKPHSHIIYPSYITTASNSTYLSNSLPRHSVDRPASQMPQSYLQETLRELQIRNGHYFGGIGINQDFLNMPESIDVNRIDHIIPDQLNSNNTSAASDGMANRTPVSSLLFSDSVKLKSLQSSEKTPSSFINNPLNKKPHSHVIHPSYITTSSNSTYRSNSLPRHSVDRPASQISQSYLQETPRDLQLQSGHYFGRIGINQDSLNMPKSIDVNRIDHITPHQLNTNNISAAQNLSNLAQQARSFNQQSGGQHIEIKANENRSIGERYDIQCPKIKAFAIQNQIERAKQSLQFFLRNTSRDLHADDRPDPQNLRSSQDTVQDLSNRHQDLRKDPRMQKNNFKSSSVQMPVNRRVTKQAETPVLAKSSNSLKKAILTAHRNSVIGDSHTHMQESPSERYINQKSMNSAEPTLVVPNSKVLPTYSTHQFTKEQSVLNHVYQNPRTKKFKVDVSTETNFNRKHVDSDKVGVKISPKVVNKMCQTDDCFEEDSLSPYQKDKSDHETNTNIDARLGYKTFAEAPSPVEIINDDSHIEESTPTVSDSMSRPRVVQDSKTTSVMHLRNITEQELLDSIAKLFGEMSNHLTIACDMFMYSRNSMIELSKTYEKLLESVHTYNATALNPK